MTATSQARGAARVFTAPPTRDGDGVDLRRAFPGAELSDLDPFLLLDQMGPAQYAPGKARGFPPHPHRGFETVTYLLSGEMEHRDSWGNHGLLRPGDVQWMTAGSGLVHSETPGKAFTKEGGKLLGFQLWVNLSRKDKMLAPRYQDTPADRIPVAQGLGVIAKVIAGEALGVRGVIETRIPILYTHVTLQPGAAFSQPVPGSWNVLAFVVESAGEFGGTTAEASQVVLFDRAGDNIAVRNTGGLPLSFLLIGGEPTGEPVARYGPFVMNSREELLQAVDDYREGRMGTL
jgi:redox-sensitive bicupin YhaK (pirin superfamily)